MFNENATIRARLVDFDEIEAKPTNWLWPDRFEAQAINLLVGNQEVGKSTLATYMAAKVRAGGTWPLLPESKIEPGSVLFLTSEENLDRTIKPRLMAMEQELPPQGGNKMIALTGLQIMTGSNVTAEKELENLTRDRGILTNAIQRVGNVRLVIIDPITDFAGSTKENSNADVRGYLAGLREIAEKENVTILGLGHFNKDAKKDAAHRTLGSVAWSAFPRTVWAIERHPDDPERRILAKIKCNNGRNPLNVGFRLRNVPMVIGGVETGYPVCDFDAKASDDTAAELLNPDVRARKIMRVNDARDWLELFLGDGPKPSNDVYDAGKIAGHSRKNLLQAAGKIGIKPEPLKDKGSTRIAIWIWALPD